jgi:hypothetical protein
MGLLHSPLAPTDGLVLCLDSANRRSYPGSGNTWFDLSGNGNNGTLINGASYNGLAMNFDGADDRVNVLRISQYESTRFSASCWILLNPTTENSNRSIFGSFAFDGTNFTGGWIIGKRRSDATDGNANKLFWIYKTATTALASYSIDLAQTRRFFHAALTYDGSRFIGYINGIQQFSDAQTYIPNTQRNLSVGGNDWGGFDVNHSGLLDDCRIYNRALNAVEVGALFNAKRKRYGL